MDPNKLYRVKYPDSISTYSVHLRPFSEGSVVALHDGVQNEELALCRLIFGKSYLHENKGNINKRLLEIEHEIGFPVAYVQKEHLECAEDLNHEQFGLTTLYPFDEAPK